LAASSSSESTGPIVLAPRAATIVDAEVDLRVIIVSTHRQAGEAVRDLAALDRELLGPQRRLERR
jgi:hypothetical protein